MQLKYVFRAHLKSKFWRLHFKITQKSALKNFIDIKTFPTYFFTIFLQHHSNRPYPNVKMILANFYIIKTLKFIITSGFGYFTHTFTSFTCYKLVRLFGFFQIKVLVYTSNWGFLSFTKVVSLQFLTSSELKCNVTINQRFEKLFFNPIITVSSIFTFFSIFDAT